MHKQLILNIFKGTIFYPCILCEKKCLLKVSCKECDQFVLDLKNNK